MIGAASDSAFVFGPVHHRGRLQRASLQAAVVPTTTESTPKQISVAGLAAGAGFVAVARPQRRWKSTSSVRKVAVSMSAVKEEKPVALTGDTLDCALKMRCDIAGADYAIYWTRVDDSWIIAGEHVTPAQRKVFEDKGMPSSFANTRKMKKLDANGDNPVAAVADSQCECFIPNATSCTIVSNDYVRDYGIDSICFVPIEAGVLEYGTTKDGPTTWESMPKCPVLPKKKMRECFENFGASYAVFWTERNGWYSARSEYVTSRRLGELKSSRGDEKTFASEIKAIKFPADGDGGVAAAARTGRVTLVASVDEETNDDRKALLKEFGVNSVYFVPVTGGVLELGTPTTAGLVGTTLQASLKMCCDATGASYAMYWCKDGGEYRVQDSYVPAAALAKLSAQGKTGNFAEASAKLRLKTGEESAVGMVADSGCSCSIPDIESHSMYFCRTAEAAEYGINSLCLLPVEGGVLEYGKNKQETIEEGEARNRLTKLEAERKIAIQAEDFDRCKKLTPEITELALKAGAADWSLMPPNCPEFPKAEIRKALDDRKASYVLFWQNRGGHYAVTADYVVPEHQKKLKEERGDNENYATRSHGLKLPVDGDGCVPTAVRSGKELVITDVQTDARFTRAELAKEFKIGEVHILPCSDGVLEYCILEA